MQDDTQLSSGGRNSQRYLVGLSVFSIALKHEIISGDHVNIYGFSISTSGIERLSLALLIAAFIWCLSHTIRYYSSLYSIIAENQIRRQSYKFHSQFDLKESDEDWHNSGYTGDEGVNSKLILLKSTLDNLMSFIDICFIYAAPLIPLLIGLIAILSPNYLTGAFLNL
ncbi:hypothetical protein AB6B38_02365 [Glycocaulis abyssi]|uniref:ABC transmembrane type-1 domain-containing protein n=1 Tax=Glycocaulis abyssi TaxID=1433403 RepID=A0ABV9NCY9_9PROT